MSIRCGCTAEGDEIVFGKIHQCSVTQPARADHVFELQEDDMRQRPWETSGMPDERARWAGMNEREALAAQDHNPPDECMCTICRAQVKIGGPDQADDLDPIVKLTLRTLTDAAKLTQEDFTLSPPEPRYLETLDEAERRGD